MVSVNVPWAQNLWPLWTVNPQILKRISACDFSIIFKRKLHGVPSWLNVHAFALLPPSFRARAGISDFRSAGYYQFLPSLIDLNNLNLNYH
jgi:hypothetical protein